MASPEEVAAPAAFSYSSTNGGECQYAASAAMTAKTKTSITKRKRTKRGLRSLISSPPRPAPAPDEEVEEEYFSTSPTTTTTTEEEEEDMAHCLILLAQGRTAAASSSSPAAEDPGLQSTGGTTIKWFGGTTTACSTAGDTLHAVYECKTCNKRFPSFQALGGHRASHKKPKQLLLLQPVPAVKVDVVNMDSSSFARIKSALTTAPPPPPPPAAAPVPANKLSSRVHECSICGSEFASGQALGGHMRRHRPVLGGANTTAAALESPEAPNSSSSSNGGGSKEEEKKCMLLSLDLNLPAPSEENAPNSMAGTFAFVDHRPLALVDCHY